ncbi:MAG: cytochrome c family protein [Rickettsiales bacterium]
MSGGNLEFNKIAASVLLAGIIAMVSGIVSEGLYAGSGHEAGHDGKEKRGYVVAGAESAGDSSSGVAKKEEKPVDIAQFMAKADIEAGKKLVKKCTSCHSFDKGGKNGVGPNQWGLMGSHFAHKEDYNYSAALEGLKDRKWTEQAVSDFLTNPKKYIPGNKMSFAGIKKPQDRANLIAYLNTLK